MTSSRVSTEQAEILLKEKKTAPIPDWTEGAASRLHGEGEKGRSRRA